MHVCVLGRKNHPLVGYCWVLLPWFPLVNKGSRKVLAAFGGPGEGGGGICWHTNSLHCWLSLGLCVLGALGLVGRLQSLRLCPGR